jgi:hypothetical protein
VNDGGEGRDFLMSESLVETGNTLSDPGLRELEDREIDAVSDRKKICWKCQRN